MELETKYFESLKAFEADCDRICARNHIDCQTLDDFMTFAKHVRCLGDVIGEMNKKGSDNQLSLDAGMMAQMAKRMFNHLGYRLVTTGSLSYGEFYHLIDRLNLELGESDYPGLYPVQYRAARMFPLLRHYIAARAAILRSLRSASAERAPALRGDHPQPSADLNPHPPKGT